MNKLDHFPFPWRITFDTNPGICNLNCTMCDTHSPYLASRFKKSALPIMDFSLLEKIVQEGVSKGLKEIIPTTMGEPLLYRKINDVFMLAEKTGVKINLTTNGTFPGKGVQFWAERILPVASDVKISCNGVTPERNGSIMRGVNTEKQLDDIRFFSAFRDQLRGEGKTNATLTIQVTLMESNLKELPDLIHFAEELGIDRVKGHHLWVTSPEIKNQDLRRSPESLKRWNLMAHQLKEMNSSMNVRLQNLNPIETGTLSMHSKHEVCPFLGREAWISADGTFNVCCCPEDLRKDFGDFGSISENIDFHSLWDSALYSNFVSQWGTHPNCLQCNMRKIREEI